MRHIDLSKISVVFLDLDRSLYAHDYPNLIDEIRSYGDSAYDDFKGMSQLESHSAPLLCMRWFVQEAKRRCIKVSVLTATTFLFANMVKKEMAIKDYGITEYAAVDTAEHKVDFIKSYARNNRVALSNILMVDDKMEVVYDMVRNGIQSIHVSNVYEMFENALINESDKNVFIECLKQ